MEKLPWHIRNRERHKENCKRWREANKQKHKEYCDNWIKENRERHNNNHRLTQKVYDEKQRIKKKNQKEEKHTIIYQSNEDEEEEEEEDDDDDDDDEEDDDDKEVVEEEVNKVLLIDKNGKEFKFPTQTLAAEYLGCARQNICDCINGRCKTVKGHKASRISGQKRGSLSRPVTLKTNKGKILKFPLHSAAAVYLDMPRTTLSNALRRGDKTVKNHTIIYQSNDDYDDGEVAGEEEDGTENNNMKSVGKDNKRKKRRRLEFDNKKLATRYTGCNTATLRLPKKGIIPVTLRNSQGEILKFPSQCSAAEYLGITHRCFGDHYIKGSEMIENHTIIREVNKQAAQEKNDLIPEPTQHQESPGNEYNDDNSTSDHKDLQIDDEEEEDEENDIKGHEKEFDEHEEYDEEEDILLD